MQFQLVGKKSPEAKKMCVRKLLATFIQISTDYYKISQKYEKTFFADLDPIQGTQNIIKYGSIKYTR